jgi:hypothetical protein
MKFVGLLLALSVTFGAGMVWSQPDQTEPAPKAKTVYKVKKVTVTKTETKTKQVKTVPADCATLREYALDMERQSVKLYGSMNEQKMILQKGKLIVLDPEMGKLNDLENEQRYLQQDILQAYGDLQESAQRIKELNCK